MGICCILNIIVLIYLSKILVCKSPSLIAVGKLYVMGYSPNMIRLMMYPEFVMITLIIWV